MAQIFHRSFNVISRLTIFGFIGFIALIGAVLYILARSPYATNVGVTRDQPVPFSHRHHVGELGIDCRYCHNSVDKSSYAGMPATKVCMNCHQQIWVGSPMLDPIRESYKTNQSLAWQRVHRLADFVYFDHSVHVNKGVGCASCHGRVDDMPLMYQHGTLLMEWCLDCHRQPEQHVRPKNQVFNMAWTAGDETDPAGKPYSQFELGKMLVETSKIRKLDNCSTCHR